MVVGLPEVAEGPRRPRRSRCRALDPPPARDVAGIVREQPELPGRTDHLVVDGSNDPLGRRIHGREGVDDRHDRAVAVVQRVADPGLGQAQQERARGGFKSHRRHSSTSREAGSWPLRALKSTWNPHETAAHQCQRRAAALPAETVGGHLQTRPAHGCRERGEGADNGPVTDQRSLPGEGWALRASKSTGEPARGQTIRTREAVPEGLRCPSPGLRGVRDVRIERPDGRNHTGRGCRGGGGGGRKHIELAGDPEGREINMARRPVAGAARLGSVHLFVDVTGRYRTLVLLAARGGGGSPISGFLRRCATC